MNALRYRARFIFAARIHDIIIKEIHLGNSARIKFEITTAKQELDLDGLHFINRILCRQEKIIAFFVCKTVLVRDVVVFKSL